MVLTRALHCLLSVELHYAVFNFLEQYLAAVAGFIILT